MAHVDKISLALLAVALLLLVVATGPPGVGAVLGAVCCLGLVRAVGPGR
jgi:hypothetical protein